MIIRFSNKTENEGFVVADKVVSNMNVLREILRHEDTVVFYDMNSGFSSLNEVLSFVEEMMEKSIFVIFEKEQMHFTSMKDEKCVAAVKMLKALTSFVDCKKTEEKSSKSNILNDVMFFYKKNAERFEWNNATKNLDEKIGYRRICRDFVEYYMRPDDFKFYFVEGTKTTSKEVYKILKEADVLIYETGRNDTYCKFSDGRKRYIGIRIRSESEVKDDSTKTRSDVKHVMITSPKKVVKTVLTNAIRDEIIELAFGGMDAYELSKTFNIEVRTIKNILNGLA